MAEFRSIADLEGSSIVEGDIVVFDVGGEVLRYRVLPTHLSNPMGRNAEVFRLIGVGMDGKRAFCTDAYGYSAKDCDFPECTVNDWTALTKVVRAIYRRISCGSGAVVSDAGGVKMELKDVKKENLKVAKAKFDEERANAEVEFAKAKLRAATDAIDGLDRQIKALRESRLEHEKVLSEFSFSKG